MKILWASNAAFTPTGYGVATKSVTSQMVAHGDHEPHVLAYWGIQGAKMDIDGVMHYAPTSADVWANDYLVPLHQFLRADLSLLHRDLWVNDQRLGQQVPLAAWFPVDSAPLAEDNIERLKETRFPATMSRFAQKLCMDAGFIVEYIPHSVDGTVYKYNRDRAGRKTMAVPDDAFLVMIVGANKGFPSRKGFPEMFEAVAQFQRERPDVWLYVHSLITNQQGGPNLQTLADKTGCDLKRVVLLSDFLFWFGLDNDVMASLYSAADVLLNTSYGEGFGIPILEAQACGTPVITTDFSAMPEITWNGRAVEGTPMLTPHYTYWSVPKVGAIVDALREQYRFRDEAKAERVAENIATGWTDAAVYERYWQPWLARIESELPPPGAAK